MKYPPALPSLALVLGLLGCSAPSAPPVVPFTDVDGRSCNYEPATSASPRVTCDVAPGTLVTCTSPAVPSYILSTGAGLNPSQSNCAACRTGSEYTGLTACALVECLVAEDCPMSNYECVGGICHRDF
jgi:hypothetical protein